MKLPLSVDPVTREAYRQIEAQDKLTQKTNQDVLIGSGRSLVLTDSSGVQHAVLVNTSGAIGTTLGGYPTVYTAGEGISLASSTFALDVNGLTVDGTPDENADYVLTYDASAGGHKKVLLTNLPASGGATTLGSLTDTNISASPSGKYLRHNGTEWVDGSLVITVGDLPSHTHPWTEITSTPSTLAGYGITDAYTKTETDTLLSGKADVSHTHTLSDIQDGGSGTGTGRLVVGSASGADTIAGPGAAGLVLKSTGSGISAGYEWGEVTTGVTSLSAGDGLDGGGTGAVTINVTPYTGIDTNYAHTAIVGDAVAVPIGSGAQDVAAGNHGITSHPETGLTSGHVLRATGATTYGWGTIPSHSHDLGDLQDAGTGTGSGRIVVATSSGADTIAAPSAAGQVLKSTSSGIGAGYEWGDVTTGVTSISAGDGLDGGGAGSVTLNVNPYSGIATDRGQTAIESDAIAVVLGTTGNTAAAGNHDHTGVYQPVDADLTAIAALSGDGFLRKSTGTWQMGSIAAGDLPSHDIVSAHSASGLTSGHVLRATGATSFAFGALQSSDLPSHTHDLGDLTDAGSGTGSGRIVVATSSGADTIAGPSASGQVLKALTTGLTATYEWGDVTTGVTSISAGDGLDGGGAGSVTLNVNPYSGIATDRGQTVIESDAIAVVLGTTGNTAAAGNHTHSVGDVSGAVATTRALTAGSGLTGGGDLSADRTFNVGAGTGIAVAADSVGLTGQALALHNLATSGLIARTGTGTVAGRTLTAGSGIDVTNGNGVSGNPTVAVDADVVIITVSGSAPVGSPSRAGDMHVVV